MKPNKNNTLFGATDYAVKEVNLLIVMGAIPEEFVEFDPDKGFEIDYLITSFMENFPKEQLPDPWAVAFGNYMRQAFQLLKYETEPTVGIREFAHGEIGLGFVDTKLLSSQLKIKKSKLDKLLNRVIEQNPDIQPFLMHDTVAGNVVSSFLLSQLDRVGIRLDKYLKAIEKGNKRFEVN